MDTDDFVGIAWLLVLVVGIVVLLINIARVFVVPTGLSIFDGTVGVIVSAVFVIFSILLIKDYLS